jgi:glycosyltransferase involved in cell wall biosynthesis
MAHEDSATLSDETSTGREAAKGGRPAVLQVLPALDTGGVERGTVDIAVAVIESGGRSIVASEGGRLERQLLRAGAEHLRLPLASKNPLVMRRNADRLAQAIERLDVDIVHARSRAPAWSARSAARRTGRHFVTTFHGTYGLSDPFKRAYNAIMTTGERVIAPSEFIAAHIQDNYKIDPRRVRVIQRGIDLDIFNPARVSAQRVIKLAKAWRVPDDLPLVMLPARFSRWKGQTLLLQALTHLRDLEFCCVLIGADRGRAAYRRELEALIARLDLRSRAFIVEGCDDMAAAYMLADVVVSASTEPEAFGRVICEAQAMGRPVVASDHGGMREQVLPEVTAFPFPPGDEAALALTLRRALGLSRSEREHVSRQAEAHVRANFSKERMCAQTLVLYRELLGLETDGAAGLAPSAPARP